MRHFHQKQELGSNDISYLLVETGQKYELKFIEDHPQMDPPIFQGVKFWLNRSSVTINEKLIKAPESLVIWHREENIVNKRANDHLHCYVSQSLNFEIIETFDKDPNIGIFNVWTADNRRCYEFSGSSYIKERIDRKGRSYEARHGWAEGKGPTLKFTLNRSA